MSGAWVEREEQECEPGVTPGAGSAPVVLKSPSYIHTLIVHVSLY